MTIVTDELENYILYVVLRRAEGGGQTHSTTLPEEYQACLFSPQPYQSTQGGGNFSPGTV
jgi:hypothetical protein